METVDGRDGIFYSVEGLFVDFDLKTVRGWCGGFSSFPRDLTVVKIRTPIKATKNKQV
jgi:hypothetical protein